MSKHEHVISDSAAVEALVSKPFADKTVFGFWVYLMTDLVLFATLFAVYGVLHNNIADGPAGKEIFDMPYVLVETLLLLTSSYTSGLGLLAAHKAAAAGSTAKAGVHASKTPVLLWFGITFLLGASFLGMEIHEFAALAHEGYSWQRSGFLSAFFTLVGTHGAHITAGLVWMTVLLYKVYTTAKPTPQLFKRLTLLSIFWHMLDVVWIFIFTIVYLLGVA